MSSMVKLKSRLATASRTQTIAGLELVAIAMSSAMRELGCGGSDLALVTRGLAFGLVRQAGVRFIDKSGLTVGEVEMDFDADRMCLDVGGHSMEIDPNRPVSGQISRALDTFLKGARRQFETQGATRREIVVSFTNDIYADEERTVKARQVLGTSPAAAANYGNFERVKGGSFTAGRLASLGFSIFGRKQ